MRAEIKVHFKKKETQINIKVPLTREERDIITQCIITLVEKLKADNVEVISTAPYKDISKIRKKLKNIEIRIIDNNYKNSNNQPQPQSKEEIKEEFDSKKALEEIRKFNEELENMLKK